MRELVIMAQTRIRCVLAQRRYLKAILAIVKIQARFRAFKDYKVYNSVRSATILIQAYYRGCCERSKYDQIRYNTVYLQAHIRGAIARRQYQNTKRSIVAIQSQYRRFVAERQYTKERGAIIVIQTFVRAVRARVAASTLRHLNAIYVESEKMYENCTQIQTWYRCQKARRSYMNMKRAALIIQTRQRGSVARKVYQHTVQSMSIVIIQSFCRAALARVAVMKLRQLQVALSMSMEVYKGSIRIQTWYRCQNTRRSYDNMKTAATTIQTRQRAHTNRKLYKNMITSAIIIQARQRGNTARESYRRVTQSIITIQSFIRMIPLRMEYLLAKELSEETDLYTNNNLHEESYRPASYFRFDEISKEDEESQEAYTQSKDDKTKDDETYQETYAMPQDMPKHMQSSREICKIDEETVEESNESNESTQNQQASLDSSTKARKLENVHSVEDTIISIQKQLSEDSPLNSGSVDRELMSELGNALYYLRQQVIDLQRDNEGLKAQVGELENDKAGIVHYAHSLEATANMSKLSSLELQKSNQVLIAEISVAKKENSKIRRELMDIEAEREADFVPLQKKFQRLLYDRDSEIRALKNAASNNIEIRNKEALATEKKFADERESYLTEIHRLKDKVKKKQDSSSRSEYNNKLINVLEASQSSRNEETRRLKKEVKTLKRQLESLSSKPDKDKMLLTRDEKPDKGNILLKRDEAVFLKNNLVSRQNTRNQELLNLVTTSKKLSTREKKMTGSTQSRHKGPFTINRGIESTGSFQDETLTNEFINSVEELYTSEKRWQTEYNKVMDDVFNKGIESDRVLPRRSISPKLNRSIRQNLQASTRLYSRSSSIFNGKPSY
mmetsp:Transcript_3959/g.5163  ORF Transcript_3959/g.5163 Transcript_3959/m.5163 type:complete len:846 (-) Transcript_3959:1693-4230(-)